MEPLDFESELLKLFANAKETQTYRPGEEIVREGEEGHVMYVVLEGNVEIRIAGVAIRTLHPGELFGEMTLIDSHPRSAGAVALTDTRLALVDRRMFLRFVQEAPLFALHVMQVMATRLRTLDASVRDLFELGTRGEAP